MARLELVPESKARNSIRTPLSTMTKHLRIIEGEYTDPLILLATCFKDSRLSSGAFSSNVTGRGLCHSRVMLSGSGRKKKAAMGSRYEGWNAAQRERVAAQVPIVKHWRIIEGDYTDAPNLTATWFVDPPYSNRAGSYYVHTDVDYAALGSWCQARAGQTIVCENEGATWLPFQPFGRFRCMNRVRMELRRYCGNVRP